MTEQLAVSVEPCWFGPAARPLLGWYHAPIGAAPVGGVVLCAPFGHEYMVSYRAYRRLAMRLAAAGIAVLRFDYDGTGDSAGDTSDGGRVAAWRRSTVLAAAELRRLSGSGRLALFGVRLGALLAASVATEVQAEALVLVAPVLAGRAYTRELLAFRNMNAGASGPAPTAEADVVAGYPLTDETAADLAKIDLAKLPGPLAAAALVVARDDVPGNEARLLAALSAAGTEAQASETPGYAAMMPDDAYKSTVPEALWNEVVAWVSGRFLRPVGQTTTNVPASLNADPGVGTAPLGRSVTLTVGGQPVREEIVTFAGLVGVLCEPAGPRPAVTQPAVTAQAAQAAPTIVMTNIGANHRTGTHRLWVTTARTLAARGYRTLRFDRAGLGDSPVAAGGRENDVYGEGGIANVSAALDYLKAARGDGRAVLMGLCSGAYFAYHAAVGDPRVVGTIMINPLAFHWREGDSLEVRMRKTYKSTGFYLRAALSRRTWARVVKGEINVRGILRVLAERIGSRVLSRSQRLTAVARGMAPQLSDVARGFQALDARGVESLLMFGADDAGIDLMAELLGPDWRRGAGGQRFRVEIIQGTDHTFSPLWAQERLRDLISNHMAKRFP